MEGMKKAVVGIEVREQSQESREEKRSEKRGGEFEHPSLPLSHQQSFIRLCVDLCVCA